MPGQQRCFKCGSILEGEITILDVHPPRMAGWKRPWRQLARHLHTTYKAEEEHKTPGRYEPDYANLKAIKGFVLSIIPGLGHVVMGEGLRISLVVLAWIIALALAFWLIPSQWGWLSLGIGAGLHAWLALDAGLLRLLDKLTEKLAAVGAGFVIFVIVYLGASLIVQPIHPRNGRAPSLGLGRSFFEKANLDIPGERIVIGDILRLSPWDPNAPINRGTLIRHNAQVFAFYRYHTARLRQRDDRAMGQIIGLPQEWIAVDANQYLVNNRRLDPNQYPVPLWLRGKTLKPIQIPPEKLFVSTPYNTGQPINSKLAHQACLVDPNDIDGKATMLWLPARRRHRLVPDPNEGSWQP